MIRRFVDWYIKKYWKSEFILREDIGKALLGAKAIERERLAKVHAEQMDTLRERMELDKIMAVEELQAQKLQIEAEMEEMVKRMWYIAGFIVGCVLMALFSFYMERYRKTDIEEEIDSAKRDVFRGRFK